MVADLGSLFLVTDVAQEPVSLEDCKTFLRVQVDDENALIEGLIVSAREYIETFTRRGLLTQTWNWKLDGFPEGPLVLPMSPIQSVTSVTYTDTAGTSQTWSSSLYDTHLPSGEKPGRALIRPAYSQYYPTTRAIMDAVTVKFVAGYGDNPSNVPQRLRDGLKFLVALDYYGRQSQDGPSRDEIEARFLWPYRLF